MIQLVTDNSCSPVFHFKKIAAGSKSGTKATIHTRESHDRLNTRQPEDYIYFVRFDGPSFDGTIKTLTPSKSLRTINIRDCA